MPAEEWDVFSLSPGGDYDQPEFLATLYEANQKSIRVELDGAGSGQFAINRTSPECTEAILAQGNLVKVRIPEIDTDYIFAYFIESGDIILISSQEQGGEMLTFGGRGNLSYLEYARADRRSYITGGDDPEAGVWRAYAAGTGAAPGQILRRLLEEFQHADRIYGVAESHPIPLVTLDFDYDDDSTGDPWDETDATDEFSYQVGEDGLAIVQRLIETDTITVQMSPDFLLSGYNRDNFGRDLTGDDFGAGVVRFERGVNIATELRREQTPDRVGTHNLVQGEADKYGGAVLADASARPTKEVFIQSFGTGTTALNGIGAADLADRLKKSDLIVFQIANRRTNVELAAPVTVGSTVGAVATDGFYLPGPEGTNGDFWVGDTVRVHTGSGPFDYNEVNAVVQAITITREDDNKELTVTVELQEVPVVPCAAFTAEWDLPLTVSGFYHPLGGIPPVYPNTPDILFYKTGSSPTYPISPDHSSDIWPFPVFDIAGGPAGYHDTAWGNVNAIAEIYLVGPGTLTAHSVVTIGSPGEYDLQVEHGDEATSSFIDPDNYGPFAAGVDTEIVIPDDGHCAHVVRMNLLGTSNVEFTGFAGFTWDGTFA